MSLNPPEAAHTRPHYDMPTQRSSSPTPSEIEENDDTPFGFRNLLSTGGKKKRSPWMYVGLIALAIIFIVVFALKDKIVDAIQPAANDLRNLKGGWAIPIGILIVISFPPLFGHEIIAIMVGVVWGVWKGFLIVSAGTLLGEIANWFVFKYWCTGRAKQFEAKQLAYACLARVVREGGFWVVLVIRYSAIPGHFTTVVFSVTGISFWVYLLAAILSLPKQLITVYVGVAAQSNDESKGSKILSGVVIAVGVIITIVSARWTFKRMDAVKPAIVAERRAARALKRERQQMEMMNGGGGGGGPASDQPHTPLLSDPDNGGVGYPRPSEDGYTTYNSAQSHPPYYDPPQGIYPPPPPQTLHPLGPYAPPPTTAYPPPSGPPPSGPPPY